MPAPIIPFADRPERYPATFTVGQVIRRCDPTGLRYSRESRYFVRSIYPNRIYHICEETPIMATLHEVGLDGRVQVESSEHFVRFFDPVDTPLNLILPEGLTFVGYQKPPIKTSNTKHKIGVPKGALP